MALFDREGISTLLQHIRAGCDIDKSCTVARIPRSTYYRWLKEGDEARADVSPDEWSEHQQQVVEFCDAVELAKAQSVTSLELVIAQAARSEWRAAQVMLKKHESGSWNGQSKVELTGAAGGPIEVTSIPAGPDMSDPDTVRAIWTARAEMGDAQAEALLAALNA